MGFSLPLKKGDKGDDVTKLQLMLIEHNYLLDGADGSYGGKAVKAIKQVQADAGLEETGVADEATVRFLMDHYAEFEPKKDSDMLLYTIECDPDTHILTIHVKNTGKQRVTQYTFKLTQCTKSKGALGSFYGAKNRTTTNKKKHRKTRYTNWTTHSLSTSIDSGELGSASINLSEGYPVMFSDGTLQEVSYFEKGELAGVTLSEFVTEDGKKHKLNQKLYCSFR